MTTKQMMDIFYTPSKNDLSSEGLDLCSLEKYMLTHTFFDGFKETEKAEPIIPVSKPVLVEQLKPVLQETIKTEPIIPVSKPVLVEQLKPQPIKTRFRAYLKDSLFWCMYVHSHGHTAFETHKAIGTNMLNLMMTEKRIISEFFNKDENKTALKNTNHKITNIKINEIKCDLMTKPMLTSIEALIPCCVYWKCPIYVDLGNKTFLHFVPNTYVSDDDNTGLTDSNAVLLYMVDGRFELEMDQEKKAQGIAELRQNCYKIPHYEKPMMGIGTYKTDELQYLYDIVISARDITQCTVAKGAEHPTLLQSSKGAEHPTLPQSSKMKKQELYDAIAIKCAQGIMIRTMF